MAVRVRPAQPAVDKCVGFHTPFPGFDILSFEPHKETWRKDLDVSEWSRRGTLPVTDVPPPGKNAWKMEPGRDTTGLALHFSRGCPSPPEFIEECVCIALRNARELSESLGYWDVVGDWPTDG